MKALSVLRKPRPLDWLVAVVTIATVCFGAVHQLKADEGITCQQPGQRHELTLKDDSFSQQTLTVRQCDIVVVVNQDENSYQLVFGSKDQHVTYPGFRSLIIGTGESISIDAVETGRYELHDHLRDKARLSLVVLSQATR